VPQYGNVIQNLTDESRAQPVAFEQNFFFVLNNDTVPVSAEPSQRRSTTFARSSFQEELCRFATQPRVCFDPRRLESLPCDCVLLVFRHP
jgi:hypothetical protein